jgi:hypothetical protein
VPRLVSTAVSPVGGRTRSRAGPGPSTSSPRTSNCVARSPVRRCTITDRYGNTARSPISWVLILTAFRLMSSNPAGAGGRWASRWRRQVRPSKHDKGFITVPDPALDQERVPGVLQRWHRQGTAGTASSLALPLHRKGPEPVPLHRDLRVRPASSPNTARRAPPWADLGRPQPDAERRDIRSVPRAPRVTLNPPERREGLCALHPQWSVVC